MTWETTNQVMRQFMSTTAQDAGFSGNKRNEGRARPGMEPVTRSDLLQTVLALIGKGFRWYQSLHMRRQWLADGAQRTGESVRAVMR